MLAQAGIMLAEENAMDTTATYTVYTDTGIKVLDTLLFDTVRARSGRLLKAHGRCSIEVEGVELPGVAYEYLCRLADRRYEQHRTRYEPTLEDHRLARVYAETGEVGHDDL